MRTQLPSPKRGHSPQVSAHIYCGQTAAWIKMPLGMEVGLGPGHIVLDGDPAPSPQKGCTAPSIFDRCLLWPNGWMDQDATWYGSTPRPKQHCVRWRPSSPSPKKGAYPPSFSPYLLWPNGCMDQDATWYGGRPWPRPHCVTWGLSSPLPKGAQPPPAIFGPCLLRPNGRPS